MNPNEAFQALKPQILQNEIFINKLRTYASTSDLARYSMTPEARFLGTGRHNTHFRIGRVGDLWLATREYIGTIFDIEDAMQHPENYIDQAVSFSEKNKRVPIVCGGVRFTNNNGVTKNKVFATLTLDCF